MQAPMTHSTLARLVVVEVARVEGIQRARARRELAQEEVLGRQPPERGKAADRALERPVGVEELRSRRRAPRAVILGERDQRLDALADDPRVGVQQQDEVPRRRFDAATPACGEPEVRPARRAARPEPLADELDRAVGRPVVDDDRLVRGRRFPGSARARGARCTSRRRPKRRIRSRPRVSLSV